MVKSCCVCKTAGNDTKKSYFRIPKVITHRNEDISRLSIIRRKKWCDILNLSFNETAVRVCSDHFKSGRPAGLLDEDDVDWIPNQSLQYIRRKKRQVHKPVQKSGNTEEVSIAKAKAANVTCRFCAKTVARTLCVNIFEEENYEVLLKNIETVLSHPISTLDKLPHFACKPCVRKIEICCDWINEFHAAEKELTESYIETEANDILCDLDSILFNTIDEDLTLDGTRAQCREDKIKEIFEEIQRKDEMTSAQTSAFLETSEPAKDFIYSKEQIQSILENNSDDSEEEDEETVKNDDKVPVITEKRKLTNCSTKIRPVEKKTLKCNNCFKKFENIDDLQVHKNFCKIFFCQLCKPQISFTDKMELIKHKKSSHTNTLMCHLCGNSYSQSYLMKHFRNHFEKSKECPVCGKVLKNTTLLMAHMGKIHDNKYSQVCDACGGTYKNLKKHLNECNKNSTVAGET